MTVRWTPLGLALAALTFAPPSLAENNCVPALSAVTDVQAALAPSSEPPQQDVIEVKTTEDLTDFEALYTTPKLSEMPASFKLPSRFVVAARFAMNNSFPNGRSQEHGGLMVKDKDDQWVFRRGDSGQSAMWQTNHDDKQAGNRIYALFHTHPYDATEGGYTHMTFSGQDIALLLVLEEPITVIQSGTGFFAMARSQEFDDWKDKMNPSEIDQAFSAMSTDFNMNLERAGRMFREPPEQLDWAVKQLALKYKLGYYAGEQGEALKRVDVTR